MLRRVRRMLRDSFSALHPFPQSTRVPFSPPRSESTSADPVGGRLNAFPKKCIMHNHLPHIRVLFPQFFFQKYDLASAFDNNAGHAISDMLSQIFSTVFKNSRGIRERLYERWIHSLLKQRNHFSSKKIPAVLVAQVRRIFAVFQFSFAGIRDNFLPRCEEQRTNNRCAVSVNREYLQCRQFPFPGQNSAASSRRYRSHYAPLRQTSAFNSAFFVRKKA